MTLECSDPLETSTTEAEAFPNLCAADSDPLPSNEALSSLVNEDTQGEQSTAGHILMEETVSQTQTDVLVDDGTANASPLNNAVAEMCSSEPSASSFINLNLEEHDEGLKTSAGNSIKRLLGCDYDIVKFDDFRFSSRMPSEQGGIFTKPVSLSTEKW